MREQLSHLVVVLLILLGQAITAMALDQSHGDPVRSHIFNATNNCVVTIKAQTNGHTYTCSISSDQLKVLCPDAQSNEEFQQCLAQSLQEYLTESLELLAKQGIYCQKESPNTGGTAAQVYGLLSLECT